MLNQYTNIDEIISADSSISGERIDRTQTQYSSLTPADPVGFNPSILSNNIEFHVYADQTWITGNHSIQTLSQIPQYFNNQTQITFPSTPVAIDLFDTFNDLNIVNGKFRIVVNFFKNLIGSFETQHLRIDEISPDRTELRLRVISDDNVESLQQIIDFAESVNQTSSSGYYRSYLLNFSRNQCVLFVNSVVIGEYLYVKLYEPLPLQFETNFSCWVVEELKPSYIDNVLLSEPIIAEQFNILSSPNWQANYSYDTSTDTGLKNWNDLLASSTQTSQQIVDSIFSGSLSGMQLNIDYSDFNNFVFYSSAAERLTNFNYKLQLLEYYTSQSLLISGVSGSVATTNSDDFLNLKASLIGGFDNFEKYLYYESSSKLSTYEVPVENANVAILTGSYVQPVPKQNSTIPYTLYSISSPQFNSWFSGIYDSASLYDSLNKNSLIRTIPEHISLQSDNIELSTFVNMLGHHYDILYMYINHMSKINKREENPKLGMPNELLYSVAKQFGWNLTNGNQGQDLWTYVFGVDQTGAPLTGSNSVGDPSVSGQNQTYTIWRRIVNNLPLLLKSKGTKRSVQALLACYGVPQSLININEYGGPRIQRPPVYEKLNFDYALDLINNGTGNVTINYSQSINSIELRFRTDNVIDNPLLPNTMNLITFGSNTVTLDYTSGTLGTVLLNGTSSSTIELFDGGWLSALLRTTGNTIELVTKKSKYGNIIAAVSASATASFGTSGSVILGGSVDGTRLQGQLQELRFWNSSLTDITFNNHVKAPAAYNGNVEAYDELVFRLPLTQKVNHTLTSSLLGVEPNPSGISASFASWSTSTPYDSIEETYYYDGVSLGAGTYDDNKIRLESNNLFGTLDVKTRAERSEFDNAPLDSAKLGIYFSPQTMIDEDIIAHLGFTSLDEYIGDPGELDDKSYPELIQRAQTYWKKYSQRNDINAYIQIFSLFDLSFFKQLEQLLPARANKLTGLLIQPNLLERSKDTILPKIERFNSAYETIIENISPASSAVYLQYIGSIDGRIVIIDGIDDDQLSAYLTSSIAQKYNGTTYSYQYLIFSGSTPITASTPYWRSEGLCPAITSSVLSEIKQFLYSASISSSYLFAEIQDYLPAGIDNQRYSGTKMSSPGFNIASIDTIDGGPVVQSNIVNPNQLVYQSFSNNQGSFVLT
jgi:hypothetical protein